MDLTVLPCSTDLGFGLKIPRVDLSRCFGELRLGLYFLSRQPQLKRVSFGGGFSFLSPPLQTPLFAFVGNPVCANADGHFDPLNITFSNRQDAEPSNVWRCGRWCGASGDARLDKRLLAFLRR
jgi:hypothetical protein